jgi:hypothetical protein
VDEPDLPQYPSSTPEADQLTTAALAGLEPANAPAGEPERSFAPLDSTMAPVPAAQMAGEDAKPGPLFSTSETAEFRAKWSSIQAGFVDEPRVAVEQADGAVAQAMKRLAEMFAKERADLEAQWDGGGDVSTEDLRLALRRYRAFFDRLLSI